MGNGKFKKGNPGGPGRTAIPAFVREASKLTATQFVAVLQELSALSTAQVKVIEADDNLPIRSKIMASWLLAATTDNQSRQSLFDRIFGKVKETLDVNVANQVARLTDEELLASAQIAFKIVEQERSIATVGD